MVDILEIEKNLDNLKRYAAGYEGPGSAERVFQFLSDTIISMAESQKELIQNQKKMEEEIFLLNKRLQQVKEERSITSSQKSVRQSLDLRRASVQIELQNDVKNENRAEKKIDSIDRLPDILIQ